MNTKCGRLTKLCICLMALLVLTGCAAGGSENVVTSTDGSSENAVAGLLKDIIAQNTGVLDLPQPILDCRLLENDGQKSILAYIDQYHGEEDWWVFYDPAKGTVDELLPNAELYQIHSPGKITFSTQFHPGAPLDLFPTAVTMYHVGDEWQRTSYTRHINFSDKTSYGYQGSRDAGESAPAQLVEIALTADSVDLTFKGDGNYITPYLVIEPDAQDQSMKITLKNTVSAAKDPPAASRYGLVKACTRTAAQADQVLHLYFNVDCGTVKYTAGSKETCDAENYQTISLEVSQYDLVNAD